MILDLSTLNNHKQLKPNSCVPMSIETILKLLNLMPKDDFSLQEDNTKSGNSNWVFPYFNYPEINPKVQLTREYLLSDIGLPDRGQHFMQDYFEPLFTTIDTELHNNRFVIISLQSGPGTWHNEIIFDKVSESEYKTLTFYYGNDEPKIWPRQDLRTRVSSMEGTDIISFKWLDKEKPKP